jgi:hypothetical protein
VRYAGSDDVWYPGHVAAVGVYGLYDVDYDHGETELCVARGRMRAVENFRDGHVAEFEEAGEGFVECKVLRHRGRAGRSVERFGFPDTPFFLYAAATSAGGAVAQFVVKLLAVLYGRRDAVTVVNAVSNGLAAVLVVGVVAALCRKRARTRKARRAAISDTGMEAWRLPSDADYDLKLKDLDSLSTGGTTLSSLTQETALSSVGDGAASPRDVCISIDFGDVGDARAGVLAASESGSHTTLDAGATDDVFVDNDIIAQSVSGTHTTLRPRESEADDEFSAESFMQEAYIGNGAEAVTMDIYDPNPSPARPGEHFPEEEKDPFPSIRDDLSP